MVSAILYIIYAGITNTHNLLLLTSFTLIIFEIIVLIVNKWSCPLTPLAKEYTADRNDNFDIYLPNWLAKYNKIIFGFIFIIGLAIVILNWTKSL